MRYDSSQEGMDSLGIFVICILTTRNARRGYANMHDTLETSTIQESVRIQKLTKHNSKLKTSKNELFWHPKHGGLLNCEIPGLQTSHSTSTPASSGKMRWGFAVG